MCTVFVTVIVGPGCTVGCEHAARSAMAGTTSKRFTVSLSNVLPSDQDGRRGRRPRKDPSPRLARAGGRASRASSRSTSRLIGESECCWMTWGGLSRTYPAADRRTEGAHQMSTLALAVSPAKVRPRVAWRVFLALAGSWLVAGLAQLEIKLPFTPVPITGQTLGVLLVGASLGTGLGVISMALYLLQW